MQRYQQIKKALGSECVMTLVVADSVNPTQLFSQLWNFLNEFETRFSRFKPESELSCFNLKAGTPIAISYEFFELLAEAERYMKLTNGLFNPFVLPALQKAGYKGSWPHPETATNQLDFSEREIVQPEHLNITPTTARIPKMAALDFGGIGKGYALDKLAQLLAENSVENFWLSLGGDIICQGKDVTNQPWSVAIAGQSSDEQIIANIENKPGELLAIATSGVTKRRGADWHHIIDPRTQQPSNSNVLTATVISLSATEADIYAKSLVIDPTISLPHTILGVALQTADHPPRIIQKGEYIHAQFV